MSHTGFAWSDEQQTAPQTPAADPRFQWSEGGEQDPEQKTTATPPPAAAKPPDEGGPVARFVNRFTGLPAHDIAEHPNAYLNPFSHEYWAKGEEEAKEQIPVEQRRPAIPGAQTYHDIKNKNYAGAAGDIAQGVLTAGQLIGGGELEEVPVRPEPAWRTAPTEGTEVPSVINRQPYAQPGRAIPEAPPTAKPPRPAPAWKTSPTEGTPVESVINRQPYAQPGRAIPEAPLPQSETSRASMENAPTEGTEDRTSSIGNPMRSAGRAIPEFAPEITRVPSTNEIRESLPEVKARTRADMLDDRAMQQEMNQGLEEQGRRARSEQLRRDIAGSSTGVTKGDLVRGARTPQPIPEAAQDLAPEWQAELDRRIAAKKAKHPRP